MKIRRTHSLGLKEARKRADRIAADLADQFSVRTAWQGDALHVEGNGVRGQLHVEEQHVEIDITLGLALRLMEAPIRSVIEKAIDDELA
jgi:putative polyhydroxyalkanoate system protein